MVAATVASGAKANISRAIVSGAESDVVTIGEENPEDIMQDCSLKTASYHVDGKLVGKLGVIGPTRMRYGEVTSIIEYLTDKLSNTCK